VDNTEPEYDSVVLEKAYLILNLMHEYAHFLLKVSIPPLDVLHIPNLYSLNHYSRQIIQDNFPINSHGDAGTMLEKQLFGSQLKKSISTLRSYCWKWQHSLRP